MSVPVRNYLKHRRDRALGSILGHAEREIWPQLSKAQQEGMRRVVVDALTSYHDSVLDLVKAGDDTSNEYNLAVLQVLERMERRPARSMRSARTSDVRPGAASTG